MLCWRLSLELWSAWTLSCPAWDCTSSAYRPSLRNSHQQGGMFASAQGTGIQPNLYKTFNTLSCFFLVSFCEILMFILSKHIFNDYQWSQTMLYFMYFYIGILYRTATQTYLSFLLCISSFSKRYILFLHKQGLGSCVLFRMGPAGRWVHNTWVNIATRLLHIMS